MIIEKYLIHYLADMLALPTYAEKPLKPPESFLVVDKLGSSVDNLIISSSVAIQSYGRSRLEAAELNEAVKRVMEVLPERPEISRCKLNSDYPYTDTETKRNRYQAVFDITHY